jgi:hypothetical protein
VRVRSSVIYATTSALILTMPIHAWTILCERAEMDPPEVAAGGTLSLIRIIDEISVAAQLEGPPVAATIDWSLVTLWRRSNLAKPEAFEQRTSLRRPDGEVSGTHSLQISLEGGFQHSRAIAKILQLTLQGPGIYEFVVEHRAEPGASWIHDANVPLSVTYQVPDLAK